MKRSLVPYYVPRKLSETLGRVRAYWQEIKRADASMPFWDDFNPGALPDVAGQLMLLKAFERPHRFQFAMVGKEVERRYGGDLMGAFSDEIEIRRPFEYFNSQCAATVESCTATCYRQSSADRAASTPADKYSRLMLPMWGEGQIRMLLGVFDWG